MRWGLLPCALLLASGCDRFLPFGAWTARSDSRLLEDRGRSSEGGRIDGAIAQPMIASGTYLGDGSKGRPIAQVGFRPDLVIVTSDKTCNNLPTQQYGCGHAAVFRTSTMPGQESKGAYGFWFTPLLDRIVSLDPSGFTVGHPPSHDAPHDDPSMPYLCVNHGGVTYYWVAFKAAPGQMVVGSYTGNGAPGRVVDGVGLQPDFLMLMPGDAERILLASSVAPPGISFALDGDLPTGDRITALRPDGFQLGSGTPHVNMAGVTYHYVAWKKVPGRVEVGWYEGNGQDDRPITGAGLRPHFLSIRGEGYRQAMMKIASTGESKDLALHFICYSEGGCWETDSIQALGLDGFTLGASDWVNGLPQPASPPIRFYWLAVGAP